METSHGRRSPNSAARDRRTGRRLANGRRARLTATALLT
jgi:hypothetical protein